MSSQIEIITAIVSQTKKFMIHV